MSLADVTSERSSPEPDDDCPECDTGASVTSDLHKYQVACTCKSPSSAQYACAEEPGPPAPAKSGDVPPALPPRPAATLAATNRRNNAALPSGGGGVGAGAGGPPTCARRRKYAWWCVGCGALAAALGGLLAAAHILLRAHTASPHHLETVPAAVPAAMLVLTGVCIMSLARRRNRYSYMIKVVGACCLVCALTCVLVTITTTVIHMNKLQTLKFCEYTRLTRTCTCFSLPPDHHHSGDEDEGVRCVFEGVTDCGVVHGVLYWCLRGVFALSVAAVLVCIFSSMLAYQLLSHERKKMYWEQLELRCRSLYRAPPAGAAVPRPRPAQAQCSCCQQCLPQQPAWDISLQHRFWAPGRIGNLYSPNPGTMRKTSAWSWFPWPRTNSQRCRMAAAAPQSGDSAYGFCDTSGEHPADPAYPERTYPAGYPPGAHFATLPRHAPAGFNQAGFAQLPNGFTPSTAGFAQSTAGFAQSSGYEGGGFDEASGSYELHNGVWGPPPPYSPQGRGGSRHHLHQDPAATNLLHHHHIEMHRGSAHDRSGSSVALHTCGAARTSYITHHHPDAHVTDAPHFREGHVTDAPHFRESHVTDAPHFRELTNVDMTRMGPDMVVMSSDSARGPDSARLAAEIARMNQCVSERGRFTRQGLEAEMARLGSEAGRCSTLRGHLVPYSGCQRMLGMSMGNLHRDCSARDETITVECPHQGSKDHIVDSSKLGKENFAFQNDKHSPIRSSLQLECRGNTESEVYFADVSSCCNISVKADCCANPNVSALVGTIENHPESTSGESDSGSFTLTRQQRPQPQALGSKRRPRPSNEARIAELNTSNHSHDLNHSRSHEARIAELNSSARSHEARIAELNHSLRNHDARISELNNSARSHELRMVDLDSSRSHSQDANSSMREQFSRGHLNNSIREQLNNSRHSEHTPIRICESSLSEMNSMRLSDHQGSPLHSIREHSHEQRRISDQLNSSVRIDNPQDHNILDDPRMGNSPRISHHISPGIRKGREQRASPRGSARGSPLHPRQSSSDSSHKNGPDFFVPPPPAHSPLSPGTEESLISDEELERSADEFKKESSSALAPDLKYEPIREPKAPNEEFKPNHHHCYSDTNTMDSGWQSGSEKHVTD